ncbi:MAG TPA: four helix bundle protein [Candidatus Paceibacterota bacterium]
MIRSHKDLIVWQKGIDLVLSIYQLTKDFPKEEIYGLTSQIRRAAISIPSNIAEGRSRGTRKDFTQFLRVAFGSGAELETQLLIARKLSFGPEISYNKVEDQLGEVMRMLNAMIHKLNQPLKANS